jgi:hypothetical protein
LPPARKDEIGAFVDQMLQLLPDIDFTIEADIAGALRVTVHFKTPPQLGS